MKKIVLLLIVCVLMASCRTTMNKEKLSSDDCMVLIPVGVDRPAGVDIVRTYNLSISGIEDSIKLPKTTSGYLAVKIRKDSQDIIALKSRIADTGYTGKASKNDMLKELPYSPGQVVVCDFRIIHKIRKSGNHSYSGIVFNPVTEEEKEQMINQFLSQPMNSSWSD